MDLIVAGPGRAGGSLARRLVAAGHRLVGVLARDVESAAPRAAELGATLLEWERELPPADVLVVSVRDDAIEEAAARLAPHAAAVRTAVHVSGATPVSAIAPLAAHGPIGSFHPLQTLPDPEAGAARLEGAWVAVTSESDAFSEVLFGLAESMGMRPFRLADGAKPLYHAAAAAAANYPLAALAMAHRLFEAAGVPFRAAEPLVEAVIGNAFTMGPEQAITGPIARGDVGTVRSHVAAVAAAAPELADDFAAFGRALARVAGTTEDFEGVLGADG